MSIERIRNGDYCEVVVTGRVDGEAANRLEIEILTAIGEGARQLAVNMAQVKFLCSAGVRVLLQYWRQMTTAGKTFQVVEPSPEADSVLAITGFRNLMVPGSRKPQ